MLNVTSGIIQLFFTVTLSFIEFEHMQMLNTIKIILNYTSVLLTRSPNWIAHNDCKIFLLILSDNR